MVESVAAAVVRMSTRGEEESVLRPVQTSGVAVQVEVAASEESMLCVGAWGMSDTVLSGTMKHDESKNEVTISFWD